jgi:hypothetical protein
MAGSRSALPPLEALLRAIGDERAVPDLDWVSHLTGAEPSRVRDTISELGRHLEDVASIHSAHRSAGRDFYAQIRAPFELYALTRLLRPAHVLEAGVSSGVSSALFLLGLLDNGVGALHSVDLPTLQKGPKLARGESPVSIPPQRDSGWAVPPELTLSWDLQIGPSESLLPGLVESIPSVDLFLHDDLHTPTHLTFELEAIRPKRHEGSVVLADNTQWTGKAFDRFARSLGSEFYRRSGSDLVGLRVPARAVRPAPSARSPARARGAGTVRRARPKTPRSASRRKPSRDF